MFIPPHGLSHIPRPGCTPPENLLGYIPKDARRADILLLGCSDARHALFTLWSHASECNRDRGRWEEEGIVGRSGNPSEALQTLRFTLNDREPACLARVLLLLQLFLQARDRLVKHPGGRIVGFD